MLLSHLHTIFLIVDLLGVFVGALGGAIATISDERYDYDIVGVAGLALAAALGGGIARDVIIQKGPPLAFTDVRYLVAAFAGAFVALACGSGLGARTARALVIIDAMTLGLFSVSGSTRAINAGLGVLPALLLGAVTAAGGGSLRDVFSGRTPKIFEGGQLYAIAALFGSACFLACDRAGVARPLATALGAAAGLTLRLLAVYFDWQTRPVRGRAQPKTPIP